MKLETYRLFLREMTSDDFDALYAVLADSDIMQHYPYTFDDTRVRNWINKNKERYRVFGFGLWAVWPCWTSFPTTKASRRSYTGSVVKKT